MRNYRYKIQGEDIILSSEEHQAVQNQMKSGHALLSFRKGILGIDTSKIAFFKETEQATEEQQRQCDEILKLEGKKWVEPTREQLGKTMLSHEAFFKKMDWDWSKSSLNQANKNTQEV